MARGRKPKTEKPQQNQQQENKNNRPATKRDGSWPNLRRMTSNEQQ